MTPKEEAQCLELARSALQLSYLKNQPDALHLTDRVLREAIARRQEPILFVWRAPRDICIDGVRVAARSKGLMLGWLCLAHAQHGLEPLEVSMFYGDHREPSKCAQQAIRRAASDVEVHHPRLASVLRRIGVERGRLVVKGTPPLLECSSHWLPRFATSVERLQLPYDFGVTGRA